MMRRLRSALGGVLLVSGLSAHSFLKMTSALVINMESGQGPTASNDDFIIAAGGTLAESVATNDSDPQNDVLTYTVLTSPANGTISFTANGTFTYTPNNGFTGADQFTYTTCDPSALCDNATANITVFAVGVAICGTPGYDGPVNASTTVNTYFPPTANATLASGSTSVVLGAVPATDGFGNSFGSVQISSGDLLLIIQMQDALVNTTNTAAYGSGDATSGPDGFGGTGYTSINSAGLYEYVIATSAVPVTGGTLTFKGGGAGNGLIHSYTRAAGGAGIGQRRYQIIRVPQYSNLSLTSNITCPPWNGSAGGIIAFDVAGTFDFNGRTISAAGKGFRAGYQDIAGSGTNLRDLWATPTYDQASGKGEGLAGTPRYMWDGYNAVDNGAGWVGFPGDDFGKGAPANAGGGGNDHNAGGGGGGNGGFGGEGGIGWEGGGGNWPNGGRPGYRMPQALGKIYLGGGGGGGDANNALTGVKGGVGGGIVLINAGTLSGTGTVNVTGDNGDVGAYGSAPDGAGGGGAGGSILLNVTNNSPSANLTLSAAGGAGGNTLNDSGFEHGPGGGGGGGVIQYKAPGATITTGIAGGLSGRAVGGTGIKHGAFDGEPGLLRTFTQSELPTHLQGQSSTCFPTLTVNKVTTETQAVPVGDIATYTITITNSGAAGAAGGVRLRDPLPNNFTYSSATVAYAGSAAGPVTLTNLGTATVPLFGDFNIPAGGVVTLTLNATVGTGATFGTYHNGAQTFYLDPTRTTADASRLISPLTFAVTGNTAYEAGGNVLGANYNGLPAGPAGENVLITVGPVAVDDAGSVNEDATLNANLGTNDSDPDDPNSALTWALLAGGSADANGTITVNANGTYTFVPDANYNGTVSFTYTVCDDVNLCDEGLVTITVNPVNDGPVANDDSYTVSEDGTITAQNVTGNDSDIDHPNAQLTWSLLSGGTAAANGTLVFTNGTFNYTPNANFNGTVSFTYQVCDPGPLCDAATVTITVSPVNDPPIANDDDFSVNEDASLSAQSLTGNDSDPDNTNAQLVWSLVSGGTAATNGSLTVNANGTFSYTPNANYNGTVMFTYQACDPSAACDPATVTITVNPVNDAPVAGDDSYTMSEDGTITAQSVTGNDSDIDNTNAQLTWSITSAGTAGANGTLSMTAAGAFTYTPNPNFSGTVSFTYQTCDPAPLCDPATVTITVTAVNDPPVAGDDSFSVNEDASLSAQSLTANDGDPDNTTAQLTWSLVSGGTAAANGSLTVNANGTFSYTPTANFNGSVSFTYQVCDPGPLCDPATVTITVNAVNDAPVAGNDNFTMLESTVLSTTVGGNDSDVDNTNAQLTWALLSGGTAAVNGTLVFNANGTFTYTPTPLFNGIVTFTYTLCDPAPLCDNTNTVTIDVGSVNDPPVAGDDNFTMNEDAVLSNTLSGNDSDPDGDVLTYGLVSGGTAAANGVLVINANGTFTYTPAANYNGTVSFTYQACDPSNVCDPATVTIIVSPVNDTPVAGDDSYTMIEDATLTQSVTGNDSDIDNTNAQLTWSITAAGTAGANGTLSLTAAGSFTYAPNANYNGTVSFTYQACDPSSACDPATVTIIVTAVNDAPVAGDDSFTTNEDVAITAQSVTGNDSDPDNTNAQLTWSLVSGGTAATNGTLIFNANGTFTFTPNANFNGSVTYTYQVCDPSAACDPATVTITVTPVNDAPVANDDSFTTNEDVALTAQSVTGNDSDPDNTNAQLTWSLVGGGTAATNGTLVFNANGTFNWTPNANFNGSVTFTYQVCDPGPACDPATVTINVTPVNDTPVANDDSFTTNEDVALTAQSVTGNDSDPDNTNAQLTWSLVSGGTAATNGTLVFNANGTFTWTPDANYNGIVTFTYQVCDPGPACDPATVTINVTPVNDTPVANDDTFTMNEDATLSNNVGGNDSDADNTNAQLTWSLVSGGTAAANGSLTLNANGTFSYVPNANYNGTVSFTYQVCDPGPSCDPATVTITVNPVNDAPTANDDSFTVVEDGTLSNTVGGNDSDPETANSGLTWSLLSGGTAATNGTLSINANGTFSYTPNADFNGLVSFTYQVCDPSAACDPATVTINVTPVNDTPVANDDSFTTNEDVALTAQSVTGNDSDTETPNASLVWSLVSGGTAAANGTLVFNPNGTFTFTPNANFNGTVTFTYQVCDPSAACDPATVTITVVPVNDTPVANDDSFTMSEDGSLSNVLSGNDSDVDHTSGQLTWALLSGGTAAANGSLSVNSDGTFTYVPNPGFNGIVTFTYTLCDPIAACDNATVTIDVGSVNDAPIANDDAFSIPEDGVLSNTVAGNDTDPDGDVLTFSLVNGGTAATNGTLVFNANGTFTYTPNANYNGTVSFTYQVCDPSSVCDPAIVTITVTPVNDTPIANDDSFTTNEDTPLSGTVSGNDSDADGDALIWTLVSGGTAAANGTLVLSTDGTFTYAPNANFNGTVTFTYQACDASSACDPATVIITVVPVNDTPVANDDTFTMNEDGTLSNTVTANDNDTETPNASLTWSLVSGGTAAANGTLVLNANGTFTYTPNANYNGSVNFTYQLCDPGGACDQAVVTITVVPVNDTPVANDDTFTVNEDAVLSNTVATNDSDQDNTNAQLTWSLVSGGSAAANGTLVFNPPDGGLFTYTPNANYNGTVTFTYQVCDPSNACDQAVVTITVVPVNDTPVANDDAFTMNEDAILSNTVGGNDSDVDNTNAQLTWSLVSGGTAAANGTLVFNTNGTFTYTPNANYNGTVSFTYQACDPSNACDLAVVTITVVPVNDTPVANDDMFTMNEDAVLSNTVGGNDNDADNTNAQLTWSLVSGGTAAANGTLVFNANGTFTCTPNTNYNGTVSFTYQLCDPGNACDQAIVTITVVPVNDGPVALDDAFGVIEDGTLTNSVAGNDSDVDNTSGQLTWSLVEGGSADANGTVTFNADGSFTYVPDPGFNGMVSFTYQVCDPGPLCDQAIVTIDVGSDNDAPIAGDDTFIMDEDGTLANTVSNGDSDPDGDPLTWTLVSGGTAEANGTLVLNSDGTFTYVPDPDFNGTVSFTYEACDPLNFCDAATVTITVVPVNDAPIANDDNFTIPEDGSLANSVAGNDSDVDGDPLTWSLLAGGSASANGVLVFNTDGSFTWVPNSDFTGTVNFTYQACDAGPLCDPATVTITVTPANDAPVANDDAFTMNEDASLSNTVSGNDSDVDNTNGQLAWSMVNGGSAAANGTLAMSANGSFTYVPNADFNGAVDFIYQVCDPNGSCDQATVTINVLPVNDAPIANDDVYAMAESTTLTNDLGVNDSDIDGDPLTWTLVNGMSATANGTLVIDTDGTFSYTPDPGFNGTVDFTYQVCDGDGLCDDALVIITIGALNDPPNLVDDITTTNEDTPVTVDVLANDSDSDGDLDESTVIITITPGHGTATVNVDGSITYTPDVDYVGPDALQYQVCDDGTPLPAQCGTAYLDINVLPLNDAPTLFDDGFNFLEDGGTLNADVSGNDYDIDDANNTLVWSLLNGGTAAQNGTLVFNADGSFSYTPAPNFNGPVGFTYQVCDPGGLCTLAAVTINVLPVNDPPVALGDLDNTLPDVPLTTNVSANDNDTTDLSTIDLGSITIIVPPDSGSIAVNGNGTLTYTPDPGFIGTDTLIYQICDIGVPPPALCDTAILIIVVSNAYPLAIDDGYSLPEDSLLTMVVLDNDTAITGVLDPTTVTVLAGPFNGSATANPDGTITYVPNADYYGPDAFNYTVCTDLGFCSNATVLINVDPVNDPPLAANDTTLTDEDTAVTTSVVGNDLDFVDGSLGGVDSLTVAIVLPPLNGTAAVNVDGSITYTPNTDFNGIDSLSYQVCDVGYPLPSECDSAWLLIVVGPVDDTPVITDGNGSPIDTLTVTTPEDVPLEICFTATDAEGDTLDVTNSFLGPDFGVITGEGNGDTCVTYTPDPNYFGGDTVTVVVCDNFGLCDTVVVVIEVTPVNDPPQVVDVIGDATDTVSTTTPEDTPIIICLDAIDIEGDSLQVTGAAGGPLNGSVNGLADGDTCFTYTPDPDFNGTDTVHIVVCDNNGGCDTVTVIIDVTPVNDPPVVVDGGGTSIDTLNVFTLEDIPLTICFNANDVDGDSLDVESIPYGPFNGTASGTQDGDTCIIYAPDLTYNGMDTLIAVIGDGLGGTDTVVVIITVLPENDPPIIVDGGGTPIDTLNVTTPEDVPLQICLDAIDPEGFPVDATNISVIQLNGFINGLADGDTCITYTPFPDYNGTDSLYVFVCDGLNACDSVLMIITVTPVNDPPVITDGVFVPIDTAYASTEVDTPIIICLNALDVDGDTLDVTAIVNGPLNGLADSFSDGDTCFTYTPGPGYLGGDTLKAVVCDNQGACDTVLVIIDVSGPNNPPIIVDGILADADTLNFETPEDTPITICIAAIDIDGDALDITGIFGGPSNGFANGIGDGDTCFTYTPVPDWNGTDTLNAVVCDSNGGCDTVLVIILVTPVNDPPLVTDGVDPIDTLSTTTPEGTPITICPNATDVDGDTLDVTSVIDGPDNGTMTGIADGDTCFTYTPDPGFIGTDTVTVIVCDGVGACDTLVVVITVTPLSPNEPPIAVDDTASTAPGVPIDIAVLDNDSDPNGDPITVTSASASNGTVTINIDGTITYVPDSGFCGTDTIAYTVCDPFLACDDAIVVVDVPCPPVNHPPIAVDDAAGTTMGTTVIINVQGNDSDPDGDPIVITSASALHGTALINEFGSITYTPDPLFCGTDTIFYTICDPGPLCDDAIVVVDVPCPPTNDPPIAVDDSTGFDGEGVLVVDVLNNDSDPNGDPLTVTNADAANGTVTIGGNGELYYTAADGFCGIDTITYTVCDPQPLCDEAFVFVTVICPDTTDLAIPEGFSPNNDSYGDTWSIQGLERYPLAKVTIFNRWGNEVYGADPYGNDWDGRSTNSLTWDGVLPVGTYWYLLELGVEGEEVRTGYIYLNR